VEGHERYGLGAFPNPGTLFTAPGRGATAVIKRSRSEFNPTTVCSYKLRTLDYESYERLTLFLYKNSRRQV
jgi:hypothetical protein